MTDEHQGETVRLEDCTPEEIAELWGVTVQRARELMNIAKGDWCGDVFEVGSDGLARPEDHGANWNPGKGEARTHPWPDGTYGRKRRRKGGGFV